MTAGLGLIAISPFNLNAAFVYAAQNPVSGWQLVKFWVLPLIWCSRGVMVIAMSWKSRWLEVSVPHSALHGKALIYHDRAFPLPVVRPVVAISSW